MKSNRLRRTSALIVAGLVASSLAWVSAQQRGAAGVAHPDDIGGVVRSAKGREAGVWVIAETTELPTKFARIVVTDDQGRFLVPDLPRASYQVFVRGYGLVDSARQAAKPGQQLDLSVDAAPDARAAAQVYPAAWWLSMMEVPKGDLDAREATDQVRNCLNCHQLGGKATREMPASIASAATSSLDAWDRRVQMGPSGPAMAANFKRLGAQRSMFASGNERQTRAVRPWTRRGGCGSPAGSAHRRRSPRTAVRTRSASTSL